MKKYLIDLFKKLVFWKKDPVEKQDPAHRQQMDAARNGEVQTQVQVKGPGCQRVPQAQPEVSMASWSGLRVFISGPMRGKQFFNYPAFFEAAHRLRRMGHVVVNPAEIGESFGKPEEINADPKLLRQLITDELAYIPRCDSIYLLPGWQESEGALRELQVALALKLRVFVDPVDRSGRDWNDTTPPGIGIPDMDFGHREAPHGADSRAWHSQKENEDMKQVKKPAKKAVTNVKKNAKTVKNVKTPAKKAVVNKAKKAK